MTGTSKKTDTKNKIDKENDNTYSLIVYNDDINTFSHVIKSLMRVCTISFFEASMSANNIHHKGMDVIKTGNESLITPMADKLSFLGLDAVAEKQNKE